MSDPSALLAAAQAHYRAGRLAEAQDRCVRLLDGGAHHLTALQLLAQIAYQAGGNAQAARWSSEMAALALARGDADAALQGAVSAVVAEETPQTRRLFAEVAGTMRLAPDDPVVRGLLTRAIAEQWGALAPLVTAAPRLLSQRSQDDGLLRASLEAAPITDAGLEAALTQARRRLLEGGDDVAFAAALAQQCFLNGYIFWQGEDEEVQVAALKARIEAALAAGDAVADGDLAILACYVPLHAVAGIDKAQATPALAALLQQQRDEPAAEKAIAAPFVVLSPDHDDETPWPRWSGLPAPETPMPLHDYLAARFPDADLSGVPEKPDLLVAGCGTGQYALHLMRALTLGETRVFDLNRANMAFTARKADEAGLTMTYGVGDILNTAALGRRFGLIECGGVLHQLPQPLKGWEALLTVLEPGGVMRIAVHSQVAQQRFAALRASIARQGFAPTPAGIRAARHWLRQSDDPVREAPVFYTDGGCRHLLFAQGEHPLALPQIAAFLEAHALTLIGLEVPLGVAAAYRARFPGDPTATDLDNWAAFEQDNPQTFTAMIQFWVRG